MDDALDGTGDRVLVLAVASQLTSPALIAAIERRAAAGASAFHVVLPDPTEHAELTAGQRRKSRASGEALLRQALPRLSEAAHFPVEGSVSPRHDAMDAIEEILRQEPFDEILLAITHHRFSERLHLDLPHRVAHLGLPVTTVFDESSSPTADG
ncbi:MAG: hypothetical protein ABI317_14855 [Gaiellales bacterium]